MFRVFVFGSHGETVDYQTSKIHPEIPHQQTEVLKGHTRMGHHVKPSKSSLSTHFALLCTYLYIQLLPVMLSLFSVAVTKVVCLL